MRNSKSVADGLRVAILGAGYICKSAHIPALLRLEIPIVSVTDPSAAALHLTRPLLSPSVEFFNAATLEVSKEANCAIVCSPPALHAEQVRQLLARGLHVLCEKPLACGFADAQSLREQAEAAGLVLQVGYFRRFHPSASVLYDLLRNKELGDPVKCTFSGGHVFRNPPASLMSATLSGGGVLMDFGVHVFDQLLFWFDSFDIDEYADDSFGGLEANALIRAVGCVDGCSLPIEIRLSRTSELGYYGSVEFEDLSVSCPLNTGHLMNLKAIRHSDARTARRLAGELAVGPACDHISYFCQQFLEFQTRIQGGKEIVSSVADAVTVNALVGECYERRNHLTFASGW